MNRIVGKTGKRDLPAGEENFDFVGSRILLDAVEDVGWLGIDSAFDVQQAIDQHLAETFFAAGIGANY